MGKLLDAVRKVDVRDQTNVATAAAVVGRSNVDTQDDAAALIAAVLGRCNLQRERAGLKIRPRLEGLMKDFEPVISQLFEKGDYDALRCCLIDLDRNVGDVVTERGWN